MSTPSATSPQTLRRALAQIAEARAGGYGLTVEQRSEPEAGWMSAEALVSDDGPLDELLDAVARRVGIDHPPLGAEWLLEHHAWQGASLTAAAMMSGWVPDLAPSNVLVHGAGPCGALRCAAERCASSPATRRWRAPATTRSSLTSRR